MAGSGNLGRGGGEAGGEAGQNRHRSAIVAAGGLRLVTAGGLAALGLAGHPVGTWGAAGRGPAGVVRGLGEHSRAGRVTRNPQFPSLKAKCRTPRLQLLPLPRPRIHPGPARICQWDPVRRPGGLEGGFPPPTRPVGGAIGANGAPNPPFGAAHGGAIGAAGRLMLGAAGGSAVLGLAGNLVDTGDAAGRGSAGFLEAHTPFPRPGGRQERRYSY